MAPTRYERLSAQDNGFLLWESENRPMHGGGLQVFRAGPLATAEGGVDFATIRDGVESVLHEMPRFRQKLAWIPDTDRAVWVDDEHFNLDYHVRHTDSGSWPTGPGWRHRSGRSTPNSRSTTTSATPHCPDPAARSSSRSSSRASGSGASTGPGRSGSCG